MKPEWSRPQGQMHDRLDCRQRQDQVAGKAQAARDRHRLHRFEGVGLAWNHRSAHIPGAFDKPRALISSDPALFALHPYQEIPPGILWPESTPVAQATYRLTAWPLCPSDTERLARR